MQSRTALVTLSAVLAFVALTDAAEARVGRGSTANTRLARRAPISRLPAGNLTTKVRGVSYNYYAGVFYRSNPAGFVITSAPIGARVRVLPTGYHIVLVDTVPYYSYYGTYYILDEGTREYIVVEAPQAQASVDILRLTDGRVLEGRYLGGGQEEVVFEIDGEIRAHSVADVVSIEMAGPIDYH